MAAYLPWLIVLVMASFAIQGLRHRKADLTALDRRNAALALAPALILPIVLLGYLYFR